MKSSGAFYLAAIELGDQAARELAAHGVLLLRHDFDPAAKADAPEFPALDAEDFNVGEDHGGVLLVTAQLGRDLAHRGTSGFDEPVSLDRRIDRGVCMRARAVGDALDLAVRNEVDVAVAVAQAHVA